MSSAVPSAASLGVAPMHLMPPDRFVVEDVVRRAIAEDVGPGDITTLAVVLPEAQATAHLVARVSGVLAGCDVAAAVFQMIDPEVVIEACVRDGETLTPGRRIMTVHGPARGILTAERVALNFAQRLSGIATLTARYVAAVRGTGAGIIETRKTTPGLRALEKYAVRAGGGHNHRFALYDGILIKDNHLVAAGSVRGAVLSARAQAPHTMRVQVEVETLAQVQEALEADTDAILLDNMPPDQMEAAVGLIAGRAVVEASGDITLENVRAAADTGVDVISVGALTHSAPALNLGLDFAELGTQKSNPPTDG